MLMNSNYRDIPKLPIKSDYQVLKYESRKQQEVLVLILILPVLYMQDFMEEWNIAVTSFEHKDLDQDVASCVQQITY